MNPINDNDLILYYYKDGLDAGRLAEIDAALEASGKLQARYRRLCEMLDRATEAPPAPAADLEQRVWSRFEQRVGAAAGSRSSAGLIDWLRGILASARGSRLIVAGGFACALLIAVGVGYQVGRVTPPSTVLETPLEARASDRNMANRVLDGYVSGHLRATEGLLLTAVNEDSGEILDGNRELARSLVESNRLYAVAAARAGNVRLADFLRQLEPVLLEVANQSATSNVEDRQGLRDYLQRSDLLFQVRATESRIDVANKRSL
ncbi:hypothetical protein [Dokdonella sp.]|uniref:hypothetical protein n=1 Tax=Dokdonella sp. TaxID=2291710 RepID=UPI00352993E7